jgi:Ca2+:H+ antiporter
VQLNSSLLTLSVIAVLLPAAFHNAFQPTDNVGPSTNEKERHDILSISHGVCKSPSVCCPSKLMAVYPGCRYLAFQSVLSLRLSHTVITIFTFLVYLCYLWFQLVSHKNLYGDNNPGVQQSVEYPSSISNRYHVSERRIPPDLSSLRPADDVLDPTQRGACSLEAGPGEKDDEVEEPEMGIRTAIALLAIVTLVCRLFISLTVLGV